MFNLISSTNITYLNIIFACITLFFCIWSKKLRRPYILWYVVNIPSIFLHELAHFVVGLILGGRPVRFFSFTFEASKGSILLGTTVFSNINSFNALPIGIAPSIYWIILVFLFLKIDLTKYWGLMMFVSFYLLKAGKPSRTDLKIAFNLASVLIWSFLTIFVLVLVYSLKSLHFPDKSFDKSFLDNLLNLFKNFLNFLFP